MGASINPFPLIEFIFGWSSSALNSASFLDISVNNLESLISRKVAKQAAAITGFPPKGRNMAKLGMIF